MRKLLTPREKELLDIIDPYTLKLIEGGPGIRPDAPEEVKKAYEEFMELGREEMEHRYDPNWW